jgi:hypothetical protein
MQIEKEDEACSEKGTKNEEKKNEDASRST